MIIHKPHNHLPGYMLCGLPTVKAVAVMGHQEQVIRPAQVTGELHRG